VSLGNRPGERTRDTEPSLSGSIARRRRFAVCAALQGDLRLAVRTDDIALRLDFALIRRRPPAAGRAMYGEIHVLTPEQTGKAADPERSRPFD
jgi:hypothetical protein